VKVGVIPESLAERIVLSLGRVPTPIMDTLMAMLLGADGHCGNKAWLIRGAGD
jgi:hypothetical protein